MNEEIIRHLTAPPRAGTPAAQLTERECVAICLAAGLPFDVRRDGNMLIVDILEPIGIADRGDGGYVIARLKALAPNPLFDIPLPRRPLRVAFPEAAS